LQKLSSDRKTALVLACAAHAASRSDWRPSLQWTSYRLLSSLCRWTHMGMGWGLPKITESICSRSTSTSRISSFLVHCPISRLCRVVHKLQHKVRPWGVSAEM